MSAGDARAGELLDSACDGFSTLGPTAVQLWRRRDAALRCEPLPGGVRDPFDRLTGPLGHRPCDFGLSRAELHGEVARCRAAGWAGWEVAERFPDPRSVAA